MQRTHVEAEERPAGERTGDDTPAPAPSGRHKAVVLGPDGKPCRACNTKLAFGAAMRQTQTAPKPARSVPQDPCPADVEELGRSTWTFLHSAAAYYPDEPLPEQRDAMLAVLTALPHVYPCSVCAAELKDEYAREQGQASTKETAVASGDSLRRWLCGLHNGVNARLDKPLWDCSDAKRLRHRWYEPPADRDC